MIGVILAAGRGSRLGDFTDDTPKSLLQLNSSMTLLDYNIDVLRKMKVDKILIVTGFSSERIEAHVQGSDDIECVFNPFWNVCNVLGSFYMSFPYLTDSFYFLHADTIVDHSVWEKLRSNEGDVVLPYQRKECGEEEMKVTLAEDGRLLSITKEMPSEEADGEFLGIAKFDKKVIPWIIEESTAAFRGEGLHQYVEAIIQNGLSKGLDVETFDIGDAAFVEVDFAEDYEDAKRLFCD